MHFIIYSGFDRDADISVVKQIQKNLDNKKATYSLASYRESGFVGMSYNKFSDVVDDADVVIVVGGDGTVLRAAEGITEAGLETPIFAVNRDLKEDIALEADLRAFGELKVLEHIVLHHDDVKAINTEENPNNVAPQEGKGGTLDGGRLEVVLPSLSWNVIRLGK